MGTGYEKFTEDELLNKELKLRDALSHIAQERRHREEEIRREKYKNIIGAYFYHKSSNIIYQVTNVEESTYHCRYIQYYNNWGRIMLALGSSRGFIFNNDARLDEESLKEYQRISEEEAKDIIEGWKSDCVHFTF